MGSSKGFSFDHTIKDNSAEEPLIIALIDTDQDVRYWAARALGGFGGAAALNPLIIVLKSDNARVREAAAAALRKIGDDRALEPLIASLQDKVTDVRQKAATALGEIGNDKAIKHLIAALQDHDGQVHYKAALALRKFGKRAVRPLIAAFKKGISAGSIGGYALWQHLSVWAIEPLIAALNDKDSTTRREAVKALQKIRDAKTIDPLEKLAQHDQDPTVRQAAENALSEIKRKLNKQGK